MSYTFSTHFEKKKIDFTSRRLASQTQHAEQLLHERVHDGVVRVHVIDVRVADRAVRRYVLAAFNMSFLLATRMIGTSRADPPYSDAALSSRDRS